MSSAPVVRGPAADGIAAGALILAVAVSQRIALANALLVVAGLAWITGMVRGSVAYRPTWLDAALLFYVVASLMAVVWSLDRAASARAVWDLPTVLLAPVAVSVLNRRRWDLMLRALAVTVTISSSYGLWQYSQGASSLANRLHGFVDHYMTFSGWTVIVAALLAADIAFNGARRRVWTVPVFVLCVVALALSLTRGAWVGLAAALVLVVGLWKPKALLLAPLVVAVLWAVSPSAVVDRAASILDRADPSNYDRLCMARAGSRMIADHPVTGVGLDQVEAAYENYREPEAVTRSPGHLHNNVVQIAAERGLVGLAAYVAILAVFGRSVWRTLRRRETSTDPAVAGALAAVVAITVFGLFEYTWGDAEVWIPTLACLAVPFALEGPA